MTRKRDQGHRTPSVVQHSPRRAEREPRAARGEPKAVYAGMPRSEWDSGYDMIRTFVLERPPKDPDLILTALAIALGEVQSWGDFVGGSWVQMAGMSVDSVLYAPGFGIGRVYQTLERLVRWLHQRRDIDDWQAARLQHAIDEARYCYCLRVDPPGVRGLERPVGRSALTRVADCFARSLRHPVERDVAPSVVRLLGAHLDAQLGAGEDLPFGALDVDTFVLVYLEADSLEEASATCTLFGVAAAFYRWLAKEERLDPERARQHTERFASAALALSVALSA